MGLYDIWFTRLFWQRLEEKRDDKKVPQPYEMSKFLLIKRPHNPAEDEDKGADADRKLFEAMRRMTERREAMQQARQQ